MSRLEGQSAVVTGAGSGLGRAIVRRFVQEGCRVSALDVSPAKCDSLLEEFRTGVVVTCGDATALAANVDAVDAAITSFGGLDVFVANTGLWDFGVATSELPRGERLQLAFDDIFHVSVMAHLVGVQAALPSLKQSKGSVILTGSNASSHPGGGGPLYIAAKHAVVGLMRQLAYELAPDVRVNCVAPGAMSTDLRGPAALGLDQKAIHELPLVELMAELSPLQSVPDAMDYTGWYVALASRTDSRTMTGSVIECDGGERVRGRQASLDARSRAGDPRSHVDVGSG